MCLRTALEKWKQYVKNKTYNLGGGFKDVVCFHPLFREKMSSLMNIFLKRVEWHHHLVKWFCLFRRLLRVFRTNYFISIMKISECRWLTTTKIFGVRISGCFVFHMDMGSPQKWEPCSLGPKVLAFFMGSMYTLKRVSVRIVKDWYICFHGWYGYFSFAEVRWLGGKMVWKTHITHLCRARNDGKNRPREFWRTRTAWSTSFFIRCSCNDLFFSANNPFISSLT